MRAVPHSQRLAGRGRGQHCLQDEAGALDPQAESPLQAQAVGVADAAVSHAGQIHAVDDPEVGHHDGSSQEPHASQLHRHVRFPLLHESLD